MLSTILVPLDSSPAAATALPVARALASALDARISLLRVVGRPGESFETRQSGGLGVGLYLVKQLCELMDADLEVRSEPEEGTRVTIKLAVA